MDGQIKATQQNYDEWAKFIAKDLNTNKKGISNIVESYNPNDKTYKLIPGRQSMWQNLASSDAKPGDYILIKPTQFAQDIYKSVGGVNKVLDTKQSQTDYKSNIKLADKIYENGNNINQSWSSFDMDNVDDYNDRLRDNDFPESRLFMINNNLDRNIPKKNVS